LGQAVDELGHGQLAVLAEQLEDADACRVAERAEVLADQLRLGRGFRQREGRSSKACISHG
jgi:hypothetical protein